MLPVFSIVIPTYSRPVPLGECLRALTRLRYPRDRFEVLVVDDGGPGPLDGVLEPFRADLHLTLIRQPNAGPGAARNHGAERAVGQYLAFTDDDCLPDACWLMDLAHVLARSPESMVGGAVHNGAPDLCSAASQLITEAVYRHYNTDPLQARFVASNNMAVPTRMFREIGGFDPDFKWSEDRDLCDRWVHDGNRIIYTAAARVRHVRPMNARDFCRQHFGYGRGARRFHLRRSERSSGNLLLESRFHLDVGNWLWYPLTRVRPRHLLPMAALLAAWQASNFAGFMWEATRGHPDKVRDGALSFSG